MNLISKALLPAIHGLNGVIFYLAAINHKSVLLLFVSAALFVMAGVFIGWRMK